MRKIVAMSIGGVIGIGLGLSSVVFVGLLVPLAVVAALILGVGGAALGAVVTSESEDSPVGAVQEMEELD